MRTIEDFVKPTQKELFKTLRGSFENVICKKGSYILVRGEAPIMLVAHLDTVHHEPVKQICKTGDGNIIMSPQGIGGDDRCGVYALVTAYRKAAVKPWLLFTCDEEIGGHGAAAFCGSYKEKKLPKELGDLKMLVEIDRKGANDAVYYDCANNEFEDYITSKGFKTAFGSFSDISYIAPELGVAAVNLSSGYYNAHTQHEYINRVEINATIEKVVGIIADVVKPEFPKYEFVEEHFNRGYWGRGCWLDDDETPLHKPFSDTVYPGSGGIISAEQLEEEYSLLLDYYLPDDLEIVRSMDGEAGIHRLYVEEFGDYVEDDEDDELELRKVGG